MKTTNPRDYIELIEMFSIALVNGLIDKSEIIKWADNIIQKDTEPDYFIIELSLCGQKSINDIVSLINEYTGLQKPKVSGRVILGLLYKEYINKRVPLKKVVASIDWVLWQSGITQDEKSLMYGLSDDYDLAADGIAGTVEAVEKEVLRFTEIYKAFSVDNFNEWAEIDKTINDKVQHLSMLVRQEQAIFIQSQTKKKWWKLW